MAHSEDLEHLRLLSIFHYVIAGITGLIALFPLLHVAIGVAILAGIFDEGGDAPPRFFGLMFILMPMIFILCGLAMAVAVAVAGRNLQTQTGYTYCLVIAGLLCAAVPLGTVLGVFTIIVLMRPSVKQLFGVQPPR